MPLLEVQDLHTHYRTEAGTIRALGGVSFEVEKGTNFGLVGESGCGKSTLLKTIIQVLPPNAEIVSGRVLFGGRDLTAMGDEEMRKVRWQRMSMVTQSAMNALDPVHNVGWQIVEAIRAHEKTTRARAEERVREMFDLVGIDRDRFSEFPHQFSGGMRQRAIIAMALIMKPDLVIADEPTTSLDVIVQDQIFRNIRALQEKLGFAMFLVTHDIAVVIENCQRIGVMYGGRIMELGGMREVVKETAHPYTMGLKNSFPNVLNRDGELISIPGIPPRLIEDSGGCLFAPRCPFAQDRCLREEPELVRLGPDHWAACHRLDSMAEMAGLAALPATWTGSGQTG